MAVRIQVKDSEGCWRTIATVHYHPKHIIERMNAEKERFPEDPLRAIDGLGQVVDTLD